MLTDVCVRERGGEEEGEREGEEEGKRNKILNQMAEMMLALFPHMWRSWTKFYFKPLFCVGHTLKDIFDLEEKLDVFSFFLLVFIFP